MSEAIEDLRLLPRSEAYEIINGNAGVLLEGVSDEVAEMATLAALIHHSLGFLWTGFYRVVSPGRLRVGPYQGSLGCLEIEFGRGVCGTSAAEKRTIVVEDVSRFPGHISCDARSRSEIVVPVTDGSGNLIAVLDIDSASVGSFGEADITGLESIVRRFRGRSAK